MDDYIKIGKKETHQKNRAYENLCEAVYHLVPGLELVNQLDTSYFSLAQAQMIHGIQNDTRKLESRVKQLDAHLNWERKDE